MPTPSSDAATDAATAEAAAAAAVIFAEATEAAIPRVSIVKVHAGKVAAARQLEEGGGVVTLGATDRYCDSIIVAEFGWCRSWVVPLHYCCTGGHLRAL